MLSTSADAASVGSFSTSELAAAGGVPMKVVVTNTGKVAGDYVALAYVSPPNATDADLDSALQYTLVAPKKQLFVSKNDENLI